MPLDGLGINERTAQLHSRVLRGPLQLTIDLTNRCNLRCRHCFNRSGENPFVEDELTDEEVLDFLHDVVAMQPLNLCFCGGEPLLRKELLLQGIRLLAENGIRASMVTNGLLMTETVARQLVEAGVYQAQVSVDGATAESHDRLRGASGAFDKAINAIRCLTGAGIKTGVAFTPTQWNAGEFQATVEMLRNLGVSEVRTQRLMYLGRADDAGEEILPTEAQYREITRVVRKEQFSSCACEGFSVAWGDPIDHLIRFSDMLDVCCPYVSIKANGGIAPSIYLPLVVGNVRHHRLSEYWEAGLARVWTLPVVKELAQQIRSVQSMDVGSSETPSAYRDQDVIMDLIDDKLYLEVGGHDQRCGD